MRYPASEKLEIIRLVERSHLPAKQTLDMLGVPRTTFYRWYAHYRLDGEAALQDKAPLPGRVWNRIPDTVRDSLITLALERPELSPRELAVVLSLNSLAAFITMNAGLVIKSWALRSR
jgi:transposase-like protein